MTKRLIVGISGASGFVYGQRLLQMLQPLDLEVHLVVTKSALLTMATETHCKLAELGAMVHQLHRNEDIGASIASGSFRTLGMLIAPCSMKTLAEIATGNTASLLARETPLSLVHLRNMVSVTEMGAIVAPPVPAFYARPKDLDQMVDHTLGRVLDLFDIDSQAVRRWQGVVSRPEG